MFQYEALTFQQIKDPSSFRSGQVHERSNNNGAGNNGLPDLEYRFSRSHHLPKHKGFNKAGNHIDWIHSPPHKVNESSKSTVTEAILLPYSFPVDVRLL